ncbi:MerR family transcriptional regulator [Eubacteriaceae bacterium ES2]|nr:MerR family transcriptional regulator [Eubacteriaceae bacterium ES2]
MLKIGDFSKLSRISIRMLRHYDEIGLMQPRMIDPNSGYRYYSEEQLTIAGRIQALKDMDFSLAAIIEILKKYDDPDALAEFLSIKYTELQEQEKETQQRIRLLETAINRLRKDETAMNYNVTIKTLNPRYVASVRNVIPAYDQEGMLWELMMKETGNLKVDEPCYSMAIFHDEGYKENDVDVEVQISVKGNYKNTEHVVFKNVSAITFASAVLKGSYEHLTEVHSYVAQWVRDNGYEFEGAMFCIYHVSPAQTHNPDELVTEVCYPIKRK